MKLIQLNIWQGRLLREVIDFLQNEQPDFVCMQEVYSSNIDTPLYDFLNCYERIHEVFPEYYGFFSEAYKMEFMGEPFGFGNAILSKYALSGTETFPINGEYQVYKNLTNYIGNTRNLQRALVTINDTTSFTLFNHHGYWDQSPLGNNLTVDALQKVSSIIANTTGPVVFAGDLNVIPGSPALQTFNGLLQDLTETYQVKTTLSELGKVPDVPCDHIMVSDDVKVLNYETKSRLVSDHMPIVLEFEV